MVRGVVKLFKLVKREKELDREILASSISQDHRTVRIYKYYALVEEGKTTFNQNLIHRAFNFTALEGKAKRVAYNFTNSVYKRADTNLFWKTMFCNR